MASYYSTTTSQRVHEEMDDLDQLSQQGQRTQKRLAAVFGKSRKPTTSTSTSTSTNTNTSTSTNAIAIAIAIKKQQQEQQYLELELELPQKPVTRRKRPDLLSSYKRGGDSTVCCLDDTLHSSFSTLETTTLHQDESHSEVDFHFHFDFDEDDDDDYSEFGEEKEIDERPKTIRWSIDNNTTRIIARCSSDESALNLLFYSEEELAAQRHEAFLESCGLDPQEYDDA